MKRRVLSCGIFALMLVAACQRELTFAIPSDATIYVSKLGGSTSEYTLPRRSDTYHELEVWVASNQTGWSSYSGTPPSQGILVSAGNLRIQFIESEVLVHTDQGVFTKPVSPTEYAFLSR
jgi:hypothetical protein